MDQQTITPNETMQLHELLNLKNLCLTKSITMSILISDDELKSILQNDISKSKQHIKDLSELMSHSPVMTSESTEY